MNTNRLIWFATTVLFGLVGVVVGRWLGILYTEAFDTPFTAAAAVTVTVLPSDSNCLAPSRIACRVRSRCAVRW